MKILEQVYVATWVRVRHGTDAAGVCEQRFRALTLRTFDRLDCVANARMSSVYSLSMVDFML